MNKIKLCCHEDYNFGDQLSKVIVEWISKKKVKLVDRDEEKKLVAVGSILDVAREGDIIWGTGIHPSHYIRLKHYDLWRNPKNLDVRAVRGPITRDFLLSEGIPCPKIYGDPAILMPLIYPAKPNPKKKFGIIPHLFDRCLFKGKKFIDVRESWKDVINSILECEMIISSALHGIIVAEAYGIPAVWLRISHKEGIIKYLDYYMGTNRCVRPVYSIKEAIKSKGEQIPGFDTKSLIKAFKEKRIC
jgi:pyruvyltransferase